MRLILLVVTAALALPAAAQASSVSVYVPPCGLEQSKYAQCFPDEARFVGDPGEANRLAVSAGTSGELRFKDEGAPLRAGAGCTRVDEHTATCKGYGLRPNVSVGDGDDSVDSPFAGSVDAGEGNDVVSATGTINGGAGEDTLAGGASADSLQGGTGTDRITGGAENDTIVPDDNDIGTRDFVDGGEGLDVLSYAGRSSGVTLSLVDPAASEDTVTNVEALRGGDGPDRLAGDARRNFLEGGEGSDVLAGGPGSDRLNGGRGDDRLDAGPGNDGLIPGFGRDLLTCGSGLDHVSLTEITSTLDVGCERVDASQEAIDRVRLRLPLLPARLGLARLTGLECADLPCRVDMRVVVAARRHRGAILGQRLGRYRSDRVAPRSLVLRLSPSGLNLLRRMRGTMARVTVGINENGERSKLSFLTRLDPPAA